MAGSSDRASAAGQQWLRLAVLLSAAFVLRVVVRLWNGESSFLENGYAFYLQMTRTFVDGWGFCFGPGVQCAVRMPVYPLLLAPFLATGSLFPGVVILQAAIGSATAWFAYAIARTLFDQRVGFIAAALTAFNPYAIVHDTALQETVVLGALVALSVLLLINLTRINSWRLAVAAGLSLSLAVLTTSRVALLLPAALVWVSLVGGPTREARVAHTAAIGVVLVVVLGGWLVRNWRLVGAPVLTTEFGQSLWLGNNEWTFSHFPVRSIDLSERESYRHLSSARQNELAAVGHDDLAVDRLERRWATEEMTAHPGRTLWYGVRKIWIVASGQLSPARGPLVQAAYALLFVPVHLLSCVGLWQSRAARASHALLYAVLISFLVTTFIFWAHTSHKSYVDPFLFVYAAAAVPLTRSWPASSHLRSVVQVS